MNYVPDDPSQQALADAKAAGDTKWFRLIEPPELGGTIQFQAFVKSMSLAGGVDTVMTSSVALRVTGAPTRVAGA
jgi:predicted secreted protein